MLTDAVKGMFGDLSSALLLCRTGAEIDCAVCSETAASVAEYRQALSEVASHDT